MVEGGDGREKNWVYSGKTGSQGSLPQSYGCLVMRKVVTP